MNNKYTSGPWKYTGNQVITDSDVRDSRTYGYGCTKTFICSLNDGEYHEYANPDEQDANGTLIAAAPDLLEACEAMMTWANTPTVHTSEGVKIAMWELTRVGELTRAAIAKAKGLTSEQ